MIFGIDATRAYHQKKTGVGNYSYQLIKAIAKLDPPEQIRLYLQSREQLDLALVRSRFEVREIKWSLLWTQGGLALESWLHPPNLIFIPAHTIPLLGNPRVKKVVTVHDLWMQNLPQPENFIQRLYLNSTMEKARAFLADHLIAVSHATKNDIIKDLGVEPDKISVVYEGVDRDFFELEGEKREQEERRVRQKLGLGQRYILFVGTIQPRKNLVRLMEAFGLLLQKTAVANDLSLVLAGQPGWMTEEIYRTPQRLKIKDKVFFIDYVDDADLPGLYAGSQLLCLPSLHEGFGLPVLEAFAAGTLVVASQTSSLPEVGGKVPWYIDPYAVDDIAEKLREALSVDADTRRVKIEQGRRWAQSFSWEGCARETLQVFRRVMEKERTLGRR